jgi:hypothetical protein
MSEQSNRDLKTTPRGLTADELDHPSGGMMNPRLPSDRGGSGPGGFFVGASVRVFPAGVQIL